MISYFLLKMIPCQMDLYQVQSYHSILPYPLLQNVLHCQDNFSQIHKKKKKTQLIPQKSDRSNFVWESFSDSNALSVHWQVLAIQAAISQFVGVITVKLSLKDVRL